MNGLDNIALDTKTTGLREDLICEKPLYGHFIVVINKMMGQATDSQLTLELLTPEPDHIDGSEERNDIRKKLTQCFNGVSVHGLPGLAIQPGQDITYEILTPRFKEGLAKIATTIINHTYQPRKVTVGGVARELNSTTAEILVGTVIDEANKGQVKQYN